MSFKKKGSVLVAVIAVVLIFLITGKVDLSILSDSLSPTVSHTRSTEADYTITVPLDRYPQTATHIAESIAAGESAVCTIDRTGAKDNRKASLKGVPTRKGYDRDEWPMAMCQEGGAGADIAYVKPADNRGAGSWISNQLDNYPDGTRVLFEVK